VPARIFGVTRKMLAIAHRIDHFTYQQSRRAQAFDVHARPGIAVYTIDRPADRNEMTATESGSIGASFG